MTRLGKLIDRLSFNNTADLQVFTDNRQRLMAGKPPCSYRDAKKLAGEVTDNFNGRGGELAKKGDPYCALRKVGLPA